MSEIKLTKNELRAQQVKLHQLQKYLPTLQLKKALLQMQIHNTRQELHELEEALRAQKSIVESFAALLAQKLSIDITPFMRIVEIKKHHENIAGCDVPIFEEATFAPIDYDLFDTPAWLDGAIFGIRKLMVVKAKMMVVEEKKQALERELREVSIRVNLFEKVLIPRCLDNIKTIKVFLGDQQLAQVAQCKVAKMKIEEAKISHEN